MDFDLNYTPPEEDGVVVPGGFNMEEDIIDNGEEDGAEDVNIEEDGAENVNIEEDGAENINIEEDGANPDQHGVGEHTSLLACTQTNTHRENWS